MIVVMVVTIAMLWILVAVNKNNMYPNTDAEVSCQHLKYTVLVAVCYRCAH